jgi:hypothetical protein
LLVEHGTHTFLPQLPPQFSTVQAVLQRTYNSAQEAEAAGTAVVASGKRIAPEISLVQSKRDIEEPTVVVHAEQISSDSGESRI